jgi:hypothetical protein
MCFLLSLVSEAAMGPRLAFAVLNCTPRANSKRPDPALVNLLFTNNFHRASWPPGVAR